MSYTSDREIWPKHFGKNNFLPGRNISFLEPRALVQGGPLACSVPSHLGVWSRLTVQRVQYSHWPMLEDRSHGFPKALDVKRDTQIWCPALHSFCISLSTGSDFCFCFFACLMSVVVTWGGPIQRLTQFSGVSTVPTSPAFPMAGCGLSSCSPGRCSGGGTGSL